MEKTLPPLTPLSMPYFDGCKAGVLRLQRCDECQQFQFYPRIICSRCTSDKLLWQDASGNGIIASFTVVRKGVSAAYEAPYVIALIDLEEGPRLMSTLIDVEPEDVAIGLPVHVDFAQWSNEISMPVFRLC
ncbi:MAG: putative OB-fold protein [Halieaceae bacterium]|jgi:uncharacterized OB-fold protein